MIPLTKSSDAGLCCFLWSAPEQTVEQTLKTPGDLRRHPTHYDVNVINIFKMLVIQQGFWHGFYSITQPPVYNRQIKCDSSLVTLIDVPVSHVIHDLFEMCNRQLSLTPYHFPNPNTADYDWYFTFVSVLNWHQLSNCIICEHAVPNSWATPGIWT